MRYAILLSLLSAAMPACADEREPSHDELLRLIAAQQRLLADWGGLTKYGSDNAELRLKPGEMRVVFFGDEITENWTGKFFEGRPYLSRGVAGQTTPQMLVRFRQDVLDLKPAVVVIQGGSNDVASAVSPISQGTSADYFMSMVELAKAHGIRVVLASTTPVCNCAGKDYLKLRSPGKLIGLNGWLKDYAAKSGSVYLDFYSVLVSGRALRKEWTDDGLVPNAAGYQVMSVLAEKAVAEALSMKVK